MRRTNVVIADRHPVVLQGLSNVLSTAEDFNIVASCSDTASCIQAIRNLAPDIAIVDPAMPELAALIVLSINSENRSTHLVFFASSEDCELVLDATPFACSIVLKDTEPEALVQSLRHIANGRSLLPAMSAGSMVPQEQSANSDKMMTALTDRERQIMRLVSEGLSNKEIGRRLTISVGTIKVHLHNIFQKLEISNRTVLAALAIAQHDRPTGGER
ncbi:two-component system response regulator [Bradyrhizobium sacchari]|uniref:LuxR family two component transcriptional regulator n=1 Tax=Bradyrhizobium sacchari TaxID=1399419 RepID=A0A560KMV3_9BRAD|nr:response regulator transcription factor [Bradyrhizobium sacchari]OPY96565.1 two-component system response regulator [Bradyrhizobium sacchari]TWB67348.1 LuxR family two component transcriptional regulator [Bradyrhizobium sacchari]TWB84585.1 LuxR family two component transcriptional regulator [Bradyrhizobium sacchari]